MVSLHKYNPRDEHELYKFVIPVNNKNFCKNVLVIYNISLEIQVEKWIYYVGEKEKKKGLVYW